MTANEMDRSAVLEKLASKKPRRADFVLVIDDAAASAVERANQELALARMWAANPDTDSRVKAAELHVSQAEAAYPAAVLVLTFEALDRSGFERLVAAYPPSDEQRAKGFQWNAEKFAPALCAACSLNGLTAEDFVRLWQGDGDVKGWNQKEVEDCYHTALMVCTQSRNAALPKG